MQQAGMLEGAGLGDWSRLARLRGWCRLQAWRVRGTLLRLRCGRSATASAESEWAKRCEAEGAGTKSPAGEGNIPVLFGHGYLSNDAQQDAQALDDNLP